jgi:hypothetical protein
MASGIRLALLGCLLALPMCCFAATDKAPREIDRRAQRILAVQALIMRADADSLATAAALSFKQPSSPTAVELSVSAAELAPQNAPIGWLHLRLCTESALCDFRDAATVLRWVDADNGASWLPVLATAVKEKDLTEIDRVIADMAQAPRFDIYWNRLVVLMTDALKRAHGALPRGYAASDSERFELITGILNEMTPGYSPLLDACRRAGANTERRDDCLKLARIMQRADTVGAQIAGFGIEKRLLAPDSKESEALAERRALLEWRVASASQQEESGLPWMHSAAHLRLAKMRLLAREEDVCIAILREHKSPLKPAENHP